MELHQNIVIKAEYDLPYGIRSQKSGVLTTIRWVIGLIYLYRSIGRIYHWSKNDYRLKHLLFNFPRQRHVLLPLAEIQIQTTSTGTQTQGEFRHVETQTDLNQSNIINPTPQADPSQSQAGPSQPLVSQTLASQSQPQPGQSPAGYVQPQVSRSEPQTGINQPQARGKQPLLGQSQFKTSKSQPQASGNQPQVGQSQPQANQNQSQLHQNVQSAQIQLQSGQSQPQTRENPVSTLIQSEESTNITSNVNQNQSQPQSQPQTRQTPVSTLNQSQESTNRTSNVNQNQSQPRSLYQRKNNNFNRPRRDPLDEMLSYRLVNWNPEDELLGGRYQSPSRPNQTQPNQMGSQSQGGSASTQGNSTVNQNQNRPQGGRLSAYQGRPELMNRYGFAYGTKNNNLHRDSHFGMHILNIDRPFLTPMDPQFRSPNRYRMHENLMQSSDSSDDESPDRPVRIPSPINRRNPITIDSECILCSRTTQSDNLVALSCGHKAHFTCMDPKMKSNENMCPSCKRKFVSVSQLEKDCSICLMYIAKDRTMTKCKHSYHKACLDIWLREHSTCPMCREDLF